VAQVYPGLLPVATAQNHVTTKGYHTVLLEWLAVLKPNVHLSNRAVLVMCFFLSNTYFSFTLNLFLTFSLNNHVSGISLTYVQTAITS
jgi:hypothetical protein